MAAILFIDLLGARKKWQTGGVPAATSAFNHFARMVVASIKAESPTSILRGGIETDAAMIVFDTTLSALSCARRLYRWAFANQEVPTAPRLWLRGSIVRADDSVFIRHESQMAKPMNTVSVFTYSPAALDAISIEKSGFKGMRLLVRQDAIDQRTKDSLRIPFEAYSFIPLRKLRHSGYPSATDGDLIDFLWMACQEDREWHQMALHMTSRLRHSAKDSDEFAQAAATQVIFHECGALRQSVISRAKRAILKNTAQQGVAG